MPDLKIAIIGCGWLGLPLGIGLLAEGYTVKGSTTTPEKLSVLQQAAIDAFLLRLNPAPEGNLSVLLDADVLVIDIPPKAGKLGDAFHPRQVQYLAEAIRSTSLKHIIYISSTSVYPELSRVVVEEDITGPELSAAPALVEAEQIVQGLAEKRRVTILRCGGLMGYDRIPGKYIAGRTVDNGALPVNYLHRNDAVGLLKVIISQQITGTYNAVAPEHPAREAIYRKSCADFKYALPTFTEPTKPVPYKIISVDKLVQATGYVFQYPNPLNFLYGL